MNFNRTNLYNNTNHVDTVEFVLDIVYGVLVMRILQEQKFRDPNFLQKMADKNKVLALIMVYLSYYHDFVMMLILFYRQECS